MISSIELKSPSTLVLSMGHLFCGDSDFGTFGKEEIIRLLL